MKSDEELLSAWRGGDREAGNELFSRHFDAVFDFFAHKVSEDVSDLVQRTFLRCVEGLERFRGDGGPRTYFYAGARHELYDHFRLKRDDPTVDFGVSSLRDLRASPRSVLGRRDLASALVHALESIPLELQILLELRFWEGLEARDLSLVLDLPPDTVSSRLEHALRQLREQMPETDRLPRLPTDEAAFEEWARSVRPYPPPLNASA